MANLAIKGHATRSKEVIEILEMLGGMKKGKILGTETFCAYYINSDGNIDYKHYSLFNDAIQFTLEEFFEKFPYKIGDRVRVPEYESEVRISKMYWDGNEVQYEVVTDEVEWYSAKELNEFNKPNKEETFGKGIEKTINIRLFDKKETAEDIIKIDIPKGYEFAGVDNQQVVFEKIDCHYSKTYEEFCNMLKATHVEWFGYYREVLVPFQKLIIHRDVYWKIAGDQMGLGKPWEPDWTDSEFKYCIKVIGNKIECLSEMNIRCTLSFPTEEMRDAFLENFGYLIELCKELL